MSTVLLLYSGKYTFVVTLKRDESVFKKLYQIQVLTSFATQPTLFSSTTQLALSQPGTTSSFQLCLSASFF